MLPNCMWQNRASGTPGGYVTVTLLAPGSPLFADRSQYSNIQDIPGIGTQAVMGQHSKGLGPGTNVAMVNMGNGGFLVSVQVKTEVTPEEMKGLVTSAASRWNTGH